MTTWLKMNMKRLLRKDVYKRQVYVDMDDQGQCTLNRYRKDSFYWYKKMITSNGEDLSDSFTIAEPK